MDRTKEEKKKLISKRERKMMCKGIVSFLFLSGAPEHTAALDQQ